MRRVVKTVRNTSGQITSQEVIKPNQLTTFHPVIWGRTKQSLKEQLKAIHSDVRYSGKERGFYVN